MLRITRTKCTDGVLRLKLEGRLVGIWVDLLEETLEAERRAGNERVVLDLSGLSFADDRGCDVLARVERSGACCAQRSPYLRALWNCGQG